MNIIAGGRQLRRSALVGPFTSRQWLHKITYLSLVPLPFVLLYSYAAQRDAQLPPLLNNQAQAVDADSVINTWKEVNKVLEPYWTKKSSRNQLSYELLSEIDYLRKLHVKDEENLLKQLQSL